MKYIPLIVTVLCFIFSPLLFIWSVNHLFDTGVPYDISTWFAALLILTLAFKFKFRGK